MIDIINYVNNNDSCGILTFIDFEKAFDTISWQFLYECLESLNFGPSLINLIKILYNNIETCVSNNGYCSKFFTPSRGIRQGCPVSASLFLIVVEVLANKIRNNPRIRGIKIGDSEWKVLHYADDTCLFIDDENSMMLAFLVIDMFTKCSGLKMNRDKSEAYVHRVHI